eukprot:g23087.t1
MGQAQAAFAAPSDSNRHRSRHQLVLKTYTRSVANLVPGVEMARTTNQQPLLGQYKPKTGIFASVPRRTGLNSGEHITLPSNTK